jgi:hypothetical protein
MTKGTRAAFGSAGTAIACALALTAAASAPAATVVGTTGTTDDVLGYVDNRVYVQDVQTGEGGDLYMVPAPGILTSWSSMANAVPNRTQKLLITRNPEADSSWEVVARDELRTLTVPSALNTFLVRIPVAAGDQIALYSPNLQPGDLTSAVYHDFPGSGHTARYLEAAEPGASFTTAAAVGNTLLNVSATVEPDADGDGFGDETQDQCPSQTALQAACPVKKSKKCKKRKKKKGKEAGASAKKKKGCKKKKKKRG